MGVIETRWNDGEGGGGEEEVFKERLVQEEKNDGVGLEAGEATTKHGYATQVILVIFGGMFQLVLVRE